MKPSHEIAAAFLALILVVLIIAPAAAESASLAAEKILPHADFAEIWKGVRS